MTVGAPPRSGVRTRLSYSYVAGATLVVAVGTLLLLTLMHAPADSGPLEARVTAVGATVRCPICPEPIPLNDVQNLQAQQMRQFIRERLASGLSEDQVR